MTAPAVHRPMPSYILLVNYPPGAREKIRDFPKGRDLVNDMVAKAGGKIWRHFTQGPYDAVVFLEMPSEAEAQKLVMFVGTLGIQTITMRSFSEAEFVKMIGELPPRT